MDTAQWPREMGMVKANTTPMEELMGSNNNNNSNSNNPAARLMPIAEIRPARPQKEQALNCPRCNSTNTKFCYYNNYSLTQPRYFCKTCRRYWTEGGSLRNVPVGGGSRKNKGSSSTLTNPSSNNTNTSKKFPPDLNPSPPISLSSSQNPKFHEGQGQDLNLAYPVHHSMHEYGDHYPNMESSSGCNNKNSNSSNPSTAMELLKSGMHGRGMGPFMPVPMSAVYSSGYSLQDFRPPFPLDGGGAGGVGGGYGGLQGVQLFPFEDLKHGPSSNTTTTTADDFDQNRGQGGGDAPGYWNGMMGGGGSW